MKKAFLFSIAAATLFFGACKQNGETADGAGGDEKISTEIVESDKKPDIVFKETIHDFGTIIEGEKVRTDFEFTNTGDGPLVISNGSASCGCTKPIWPEKPVMPGEKGHIEVTFDSNGKDGHQVKEIKITANTVPAEHTLQISGDVVKAEQK